MNRSLPMIPDAELTRRYPPITTDDDAGFGALRTEKGHLPLQSMEVRGRIDGLLARVLVRQTFVNAFDEPLEATYIFPLPDRAAVTRFRMIVAEREIEGVLEERGQAREHYDEAMAQGRQAAIAEEDRPGVFNLRVGNLMPAERATIELTFCGVLPYADGEVTFRFPLVVAPRFIPGRPLPGPSAGDGTAVDTDAVPDASRISPPVLLPGFPNPVRLSLEVDLHDGAAGTNDVRSSLHTVLEDVGDGYRRIRIQPGERLDRDFILRFRLGGSAICSTLTLHPDANGSAGTFALTVVPPVAEREAPTRPRDVAFVLDRSGSMEGWKMVAARRAVARMIDTLADQDRFCVLAFDSTIETPPTLEPGLVSATNRHRFRAVEFLATVDARGSTEMAEPLDQAVRMLTTSSDRDRDRILVLITDGQVGNEDQILKLLGTRLEKIRAFTIGIDRAVNEGFLRRLAERGGGSCELVESEDRLDEVMSAIHRRIGTPLLTDVKLEPDGLAIALDEVVPRRLPDLFVGSPLLILGRYHGRPEGSIAIRGTTATGTATIESVPAQIRENPAIAAAWARGHIRQLEDRYAAGDRERSTLEKTIVGLSLRFRVLCRFTAYVAIDRSQVANEGGAVHRLTQPVEMPAGWSAPAAASPMRVGGRARGLAGGMARSHLKARAFRALPADVAFCRPMESALPSPPPSDPVDAFLMEAPLSAEIETPSDSSPNVTLADRLRSEVRIPPREAAALMADLANVVQGIHDQGLVHRAIRPANILLNHGGTPHLLGTPIKGHEPLDTLARTITLYMPPEYLQHGANRLDPRGDIYSLGVILYEMLAGRGPFDNSSGGGALSAWILRGSVTPPRQIHRSIPVQLEAICLKAMAKDPAARYATASEFAASLRDFLKPRRRAFWR
jgi:Ca-activated chloride channel homolog